MIQKHNVLVVDIDGTLCSVRKPSQTYAEVSPELALVDRLRSLSADGWRIILYSSRNVSTYDGNVGVINARMLPELVSWLNRHEIPYDEIHVGKPWPGDNGFYVDDRAVRPREFLELTLLELGALCARDRLAAGEA